MLVRGSFLTLFFILPFMAGAGEFDGIYRQTRASDCTSIGEPGGALQIVDGRFIGVDSTCRMLRPVNVRDMNAKLFDMECSLIPRTPAEALALAGTPEDAENLPRINTRPWRERALLMLAADGGLIMLWNGYAFKYDRCSEADVIESAIEAAD